MPSSEEEEESPAAKMSRYDVFYGDEELSDVVLQVENWDLHVHKMVLAAKSLYFKDLFYASKKSKKAKVFVIDEVAEYFKYIMDAIYDLLKKSPYGPCQGLLLDRLGDPKGEEYQDKCRRADRRWGQFDQLMPMAEKYGVASHFRTLLEYRFAAGDCHNKGCLKCTMNSLISLHHGFSKKNVKLDPKCMAFCLKRVGKYSDIFNISNSDLEDIMLQFFPDSMEDSGDSDSIHDDTLSEGSDSPRELIMMEYGDPSISDVTIVMGNYEFKVHKMTLANSSPYFRSMFFSVYKEKDDNRVVIEANGESFKLILEMIYSNGNGFADSDFLECRQGETFGSTSERVKKFWKVMPEVMKTMEFFEFPSQLVEFSLGHNYCRKEECMECGNKKVFAMLNNLDNLKKKVTSTLSTVAACLVNYLEFFPEQLSFAPNDLAELIETAKIQLEDEEADISFG